MLREYTVFNVAQCENLPPRAFGATTPKIFNSDERDATADEFLAHTGATIHEGHGEAARNSRSMATFATPAISRAGYSS
jgi:antirestriction protein ArdC